MIWKQVRENLALSNNVYKIRKAFMYILVYIYILVYYVIIQNNHYDDGTSISLLCSEDLKVECTNNILILEFHISERNKEFRNTSMNLKPQKLIHTSTYSDIAWYV